MSAFNRLARAAVCATACVVFAVHAGCASIPAPADASALQPVYQGDRVWNGVTTSHDGRVFVSYPQADGPGVQLAELDPDGAAHPYPDASWNTASPESDVAHAFVHVNGARIGPDDNLWVVDAGAPAIGMPAVPGAARVFQIDVQSGRIVRIYDLAKASKFLGYVDDIRFHGPVAYLTDSGAPGLIVLDLKTGAARRVLDGHPSTMDSRSMRADGRVLMNEKGSELRIHADQLEVSPDGAWLYYQAASGPLYRIGTQWLDDPRYSEEEVARHVEPWLDTPTTGGTAIDADGNLYLSDTDQRRILRITPRREVSTVVKDPRLIWSDAMWIDAHGFLWMPATQQNLAPGFNHGQMAVNFPVWIYKLQIHASPSPIDHE
jgi:sugar lactone lactonase YvrE